MPPAYPERIVAFIDILGFSALVKRIGEDPAIHKKLQDALNRIKAAKGAPDISTSPEKLAVSVFSDSIVISAAEENYHSVVWAAIHLQCDLLAMGVLVRGGISSGKTVHSDEMLYGEGMIKAYELESKTAIYPRVVIDPKLLARIPDSYRSTFFNVDADGLSFIDPFSMGINSYDADELLTDGYDPHEESLKLLSERISVELGTLTDVGQIAKWQWLKGQHAFASAEFEKLRTPRFWYRWREARKAKGNVSARGDDV